MANPAPPRRPGRPPDAEADQLILETALRLLSKEGFARLSIDGVAKATGVARTTIYRRYKDKAELAAAAIEHVRSSAELPDTGHTYQDLVELLDQARRQADVSFAGGMLLEERHNPEFMKVYRRRVARPRAQLTREVLERGLTRGELRADTDIDAVVELLYGAFIQHYLLRGRPGPAWPERVVGTLWAGIAADTAP
jgi:AcrR family transcriptional regulator